MSGVQHGSIWQFFPLLLLCVVASEPHTTLDHGRADSAKHSSNCSVGSFFSLVFPGFARFHHVVHFRVFHMISPNFAEENGKCIIRFSFLEGGNIRSTSLLGDFISALYVFIFCFGFWLFNCSYLILFAVVVDCCCCCSGLFVVVGCCWLLLVVVVVV